MKALILCGAAILVTSALGRQAAASATEQEIMTKLSGLRSVPDAERAKVTKELAIQIRQLPAGTQKLQLAEGLGNLSTEGDFGRDTLQEVATTLAGCLSEKPPAPVNGQPDFGYHELAQLVRYEHAKVSLNTAPYLEALAKLDELEKIRGKADFTLTDLDGTTWTRSALKGKVVLVNFWATWCPPCRKEMPDLQALYNRFKAQGFVVLAISDEGADKVKPFIAEHGYVYPVLLDPGRKVNDLYQVDGIPKSFIYNRQGHLVAQSIDMRTQRQFLELLAKAGLHLPS